MCYIMLLFMQYCGPEKFDYITQSKVSELLTLLALLVMVLVVLNGF